ncbi:MAG: PKD domain-containing protein, partial [Bacteroidota bacterium]
MQWTKIWLLAILLALPFLLEAQFFSCNDIECGTLEPNWEMADGGDAVVCEGIPFFLTAESSSPASDIDSYRWIVYDMTFNTLLDTTFNDLTPLEYLFELQDTDDCEDANHRIDFQVNLVVTSFDCANGESCRNSLKPLTVILNPIANLDFQQEVCIEEEIDFENTSCYDESFVLTFEDGTTYTTEPISHMFSDTGEQIVTLDVTGFSNGQQVCGTDQTTRNIKVVGPPIAEFGLSYEPMDQCRPVTVFFENLSQNIRGNAIQNYEWEVEPSNGWQFQNEIVGTDTTFYTAFTWDTQILFTDTGTYEVTLTVENVCGPETLTEIIEVYEAPSLDIRSPGFLCLETGSVAIDWEDYATFSGTINSVNWTFTDQDGAVISTSNQRYPLTTFDEEGTITATVSITSPCGDDEQPVSFTLQSPGGVDLSNNPTVLCTNSAPIQLNPADVTWSGSNAVTASGLFDPSMAEDNPVTLSYTPPNDCVTPGQWVINILEAPSAELEDIDPACDAITVAHEANISGTYGEVQWIHILPDGTIANTYVQNQAPSITYDVTGNHELVLLLTDDGCGIDTDTSTVEVQSIAAIIIAPLPNPICNTSDTIVLQASPEGGVWEGMGIVQDSLFVPSQFSTATNVELSYTYGEGACTRMDFININILEATPLMVEDPIILCEDTEPYILDFQPTGGVWTGNGIIDDSLGIFDPAGVVGEYELSYTFQDPAGCRSIATTTITVESFPTIELNDQAVFCETTEDIDLPNQLDLSFMPTGGNGFWSGDGIVDNVNGLFNSFQAGANGEGVYTVFFQYTLNDCVILDSTAITIVPFQLAEAGPDTSLCIQDSTYQLSGSPSNGQWYWLQNGQEIAVDSLINLYDIGEGLQVFRYVFAEGTTCEQADNVHVEIIDLANDLNAGNAITVCEASPVFNLNGFSPQGGIWSGPGITNPILGTVDPNLLAPDSSYTLRYCIDDPSIDCEACDEITLTINALPEAAFALNSTTCINETVSFINNSLNTCDYFWNFGDGNTSDEANPSHIYNNTGNYTIQLLTTSCEGCVDSFSINIFVAEPPTAAFDLTLEDSSGCAVLDISLTNQSFGTDTTQVWDFGNGDSSTLIQPGLISYEQGNFDTTYIIELAVTNTCGTVYDYDSVTVFPLPIVSFGTNVDEGCSPLLIEYGNSTLGNPERYEWYVDGLLISTDSLPPDQYFTTSDTAITVYDLQLIAYNKCGSDTLNDQITVFPPNVDAVISVDTTRGCQPLTVAFSEFSTPGANISWDFGDGNTSSENNPVHTFDTFGLFTVVQSAANCGIDVDTQIIEVWPLPEVRFEHDTFVCVGQSISFQNTSIDIRGSTWDFGDGNTSILDNPSHIYDSAGVYTVTLTANSELHDCPASFQSNVLVLGNPEIGFSPSVMSGCAPLSVDFTNTSMGAIFYQWDFGDGDTSTQVNPTHEFLLPATYQVTLVGIDEFRCFADTTVLNIVVDEVPRANFTTDTTAYCSRFDTIYTDNQTAGGGQYFWQFGQGDIIEQFETQAVIADTGWLSISLIAENSFNCRDTLLDSVYIEASPLASLDLPLDDQMGCAAHTAAFQNTSQFANLFEWDFGDNNTSSVTSPSHLFMDAGTYTVQLIAQNSNGCPSDILFTEIVVHPNPISQFQLPEDQICGFADTVFVTNESTGATDYCWLSSSGIKDTFFEPAFLFPDTGNFEITLISQNIFECLDTFSLDLQLLPSPIAALGQSDTMGCEALPISFDNQSTYANGFIWDFGDGNSTVTIPNPTHINSGRNLCRRLMIE